MRAVSRIVGPTSLSMGVVALAGGLALSVGMISGCTQLLGIADITADQGGRGSDGGDDRSPGVDVPPAQTDASPFLDGGDAGACTNDLSFAYAGGFYISFTLKTRQPDGVVALLNQREQCTIGTFWDLQMVNQALYFEIADPVTGDGVVTSKGAPLNDDLPHDIVITRDKNGLMQLTIDGRLAGTGTLHQTLGMKLPMLRIRTSVCVGEDPNVDFHGTMSNVCLGLR
jgi:Laminin G domain